MKQKNWKFFELQNVKIAKGVQAFNVYASPCNVESLVSFNPELPIKDTKSSIKKRDNTNLVTTLAFRVWKE